MAHLGTFFEAQIRLNGDSISTDYLTEENARLDVEAAGEGQVIKWYGERNLPNCRPPIVARSCALHVFEHGAWRTVNIF